MEKKKKPEDYLHLDRSAKLLIGMFVILVVFILATRGGREGIMGCLTGDRYSMDSFCFDMNYRCQVECGNWGYKFNGTTEGCKCYCDSGGYVSACSGFYYHDDDVQVQIHGDEICTYADGHSEPCGYEPGIYNSSR